MIEKDALELHAQRVACGRLGGRPRRYDLSGFEIGQAMTLPWLVDFHGRRLRGQEALHQAVRREAVRLGQKFSRVPCAAGLVVKRIG
jgi:hypothetical protein